MTRERLRAILWVVLGVIFAVSGSYLSWLHWHDMTFTFTIVVGLVLLVVSYKALEQSLL